MSEGKYPYGNNQNSLSYSTKTNPFLYCANIYVLLPTVCMDATDTWNNTTQPQFEFQCPITLLRIKPRGELVQARSSQQWLGLSYSFIFQDGWRLVLLVASKTMVQWRRRRRMRTLSSKGNQRLLRTNGSSAVNVLTITTSQSIDGRKSKLIDVKVIFSRGTTGLDQHIQYHRQAT